MIITSIDNHDIIFDKSDIQTIYAYPWHTLPSSNARTRYAYTRDSEASTISMHVLLFRPINPQGLYVDHIDGNGLNNSRSNLRLATPQQNAQNRRSYNDDGSIALKGAFFDPKLNKWRAQIQTRKLGSYPTQELACLAYDRAARLEFGEFACLNYPLIIDYSMLPSLDIPKAPKHSQYRGVSFDKTKNMWSAQISINGRMKKIGRFQSELDAAKAYDQYALEHHGSKAKLNFVKD